MSSQSRHSLSGHLGFTFAVLTALSLGHAGCSLEAPVDDPGSQCAVEFLNGGTSGRAIRDTDAGVGPRLGQSFVLERDTEINNVRVMLERNNVPSGSIIATIEFNASNLPAGAFATSNTVFASNVQAAQPTEFKFSTPVNLIANTRYWVVLQVSYPASSTTNVIWKGSETDLNAFGFAARTDTVNSFVDDTLIEDYTLAVGCKN